MIWVIIGGVKIVRSGLVVGGYKRLGMPARKYSLGL